MDGRAWRAFLNRHYDVPVGLRLEQARRVVRDAAAEERED
jgi:hypothetical protein